MQDWWLLLFGLPVLVVGLLFLPVTIRFRWQSGPVSRREVLFVFLGILRYRLALQGRSAGGNPATSGWGTMLSTVERIRTILPHVRVHRFVLRIQLGTGDAAWTGVAAGALYAILYALLTPLLPKLPPTSQLLVEPVFEGARWQLEWDTRISLPLGDLLLFLAESVLGYPGRRFPRKKRLSAVRRA